MADKHKLYLDQMFPSRLAEDLRIAGFDVLRACETGQARADDHEILEMAIEENHTLITFVNHLVILTDKREKWINTD